MSSKLNQISGGLSYYSSKMVCGPGLPYTFPIINNVFIKERDMILHEIGAAFRITPPYLSLTLLALNYIFPVVDNYMTVDKETPNMKLACYSLL